MEERLQDEYVNKIKAKIGKLQVVGWLESYNNDERKNVKKMFGLKD